ncbi:MAG: anhydro-N-acetylmuramic acid kinase [Ferruginibacter sp.]
MNKEIKKLYEIASKPSRKIIGLMSGTSLDGLDIALCKFTGSGKNTDLELQAFETISYSSDFKNNLKEVFARETVSLQKICLLNPWVAKQHAGMILDFLTRNSISAGEIDIIASHGQTIYHAPKSFHGQKGFGNATLQIGDGDHLAQLTGIITLSDFRQKHIAAGGEGAPLAMYADYLLGANDKQHVALLNIGGIANFTYIPAGSRFNEITCTDTGPGNTLMDGYLSANKIGYNYDAGGQIARQGKVNDALLQTFLAHPFFSLPLPRTTGPELFSQDYISAAINTVALTLSTEDIMATLNMLTAKTITKALKLADKTSALQTLYISGGGIHNEFLIENIKSQLPGVKVTSSAEIGLDPDAKEAILFALLANECLCVDSREATDEKYPWVSMGKISLPG